MLDGGRKLLYGDDTPTDAVVSPSAVTVETAELSRWTSKLRLVVNLRLSFAPPTIMNWWKPLNVFRLRQGLGADGAIGPATRDWLNVTPAQRAGVLALNIQRLRFAANQSFLPGSWLTFRPIQVGLPSERQSGAGSASHCRSPRSQNADDE